MQSTLEETDKHVVRLSVEVPPEEFKKDLDRAYRKVAGKVRIPGFRRGKAPKPIIDRMVGREAVLDEFVKDSLPAYYVRALREHDLVPIADPEIDLGELEEGRPLTFTATVEVRPRLTLEPERYRGLEVTVPAAEPTDEEVDGYVERLRERFAELETVERPAARGDYALADVRAHVHDREIPEASRQGALVEVGAEELAPEIDRELEGKRKGDILKFNATLGERFGELAGTEVTFQVLVKEVKAKRLPVVDDEFAKTASQFDTLEELRADLRAKLRELKEADVRAITRDRALRTLIDSVQVDLPERLVDAETEHQIMHSRERLERAGVSLEQALEVQGWDELRFRSDARAHATSEIVADLVLEAVARQEGLTVTEEDLEREVASVAAATGREPKDVRKVLVRSGQVEALAGDIIRSKALDLLVEAAEVTTEAGSKDAPAASQTPEESPDADLPQDQGDHEE